MLWGLPGPGAGGGGCWVALGSGVPVHKDGQRPASGFYSAAAAPHPISSHTQLGVESVVLHSDKDSAALAMAVGLSLLFGRGGWSPGADDLIPAEPC